MLALENVDSQALARKRVSQQQARDELKKRCQRLEQQLEKARRTRLSAYKDKAVGVLSDEEFTYISQDLRKEEARCQKELDQLSRLAEDSDQTRRIEEKIRTFLQFDHLEKSQLQQLVRRVEVDAHKHIQIFFNFADPGKGTD